MINNKNILITGGIGSFGKSYIERILENYKSNKVIIFFVMAIFLMPSIITLVR